MTAVLEAGFGIYVHWPFCAAKCPYCDFNSHVRHTSVDQARFAAAFERELEHFAAQTSNRTVQSVFLGGGTPSLMEPGTVGRVLDAIQRLWSVAPDVEVTLEANPSSVEAGRFRGYRAAGVNRVSLGVQSLHDRDLKLLGRLRWSPGPGGDRNGTHHLSPDLLRPDLRPSRSDDRGLATRAWRRDRSRCRPPVALPAHHRGRYALLRTAAGRQAHGAGPGPFGRSLPGNAGTVRSPRHACL